MGLRDPNAPATSPSCATAYSLSMSLFRFLQAPQLTNGPSHNRRCLQVITNQGCQRRRHHNAWSHHVAPATLPPTAAVTDSPPRHPAISPPSRFRRRRIAAPLCKSPRLAVQDGLVTAPTPHTLQTPPPSRLRNASSMKASPLCKPRGSPRRTRSHRHHAPQPPPRPTPAASSCNVDASIRFPTRPLHAVATCLPIAGGGGHNCRSASGSGSSLCGGSRNFGVGAEAQASAARR
jgi:hypothetical protein